MQVHKVTVDVLPPKGKQKIGRRPINRGGGILAGMTPSSFWKTWSVRAVSLRAREVAKPEPGNLPSNGNKPRARTATGNDVLMGCPKARHLFITK